MLKDDRKLFHFLGINRMKIEDVQMPYIYIYKPKEIYNKFTKSKKNL